MRVLIAPDKFAGTLTAPEAARAIAEGWLRCQPGDTVTLAPMADGGPGFVDVLAEALGGEILAATVHGPLGAEVPISMLQVGETAYIESAQACGLDLVAKLEPLKATSRGVGDAILAALAAGCGRIVLGLGGSATNDGGAGMLGALGATANVPLDRGPEALTGITVCDVSVPRKLLEGVEIVMATDVDLPLLGMFGATKTFGSQKGLDDSEIMRVDGLLDSFVVAACGKVPSERKVADDKGAGAAGGLGFALLLLGAGRVSGIDLVAEATGLAEQAAQHDLVVTGEGTFDYSSRAGKVVYGVAQAAAAGARPCIVLAGNVSVGSREMRAMGVESAYAMVDMVGESQSLSEPHASLVGLAERVARTWSY
ncbi:MAG: glycerate kinase [Actinomycetota bacterium]|nr:glycerate kinase [Actinomycetota bacterium]